MTTSILGPLEACAIADAYGAGFEFASTAFIRKHNRMVDYIPHPKFTRPVNAYTDDTQMAMGVALHLLSDLPWTAEAVAECFVRGFHRDPRKGYSQGFYDILAKVKTGAEFLTTILPHSTKNGGAMRAFPIGYLPDATRVRDLAMMQASVTHATWGGMTAAAAAALMFHHRYHRVGPKSALAWYLSKMLPGVDWGAKPTTKPGTDGIETVQLALIALTKGQSLADVVQLAVSFGGDTDTVAAIAAPAAAVCPETRNALPQALVDGLEKGGYGQSYIRGLDSDMRDKFPPSYLTAPAATPTKAKLPKAGPPPDPPATPSEPKAPGPLDFLFE